MKFLQWRRIGTTITIDEMLSLDGMSYGMVDGGGREARTVKSRGDPILGLGGDHTLLEVATT